MMLSIVYLEVCINFFSLSVYHIQVDSYIGTGKASGILYAVDHM